MWLSFLLTFWLLLTVARQVFDLIGRLWIPVAFNLIQLVCIISGLFGVCQRRLSLLVAFSVSCGFSIAQNTLISLWYLGVFGDRTRPVLSAGLPYSFSFFLRFTPGCDSHFDLARSRWVQSPCLFQYYHLETALAFLNIAIAIVSIFLCIHVIFTIRKERKEPKTPMPSVYSQLGSRKLPAAPSSINDVSSGYMNSSYEEVNEIVQQLPLPPPPDVTPRVKGFERNSKKKRGKPRPQSMPQPDAYSSAETEHIAREDFYTKPQKKSSGRFKKQQQEPLSRRNTVGEENRDRRSTRSLSANTTSLVSFDPKSGTLLRVREHVDSDDDYASRRERSVDGEAVYERIRPREGPVPLAGSRAKNISQDSVPSTLAPVFVSPTADGSSCDSGVPSSSYEQWPPAARPIVDLAAIASPGIRLSKMENAPSPGIRLTSAVENSRRSSFQVQMPRESRRVIGHYHSVNEFPLTEGDDRPVINGKSLLV